MSENPRPASTPPTLAPGDKEEREEDRIAAELEVNTIRLVRLLGKLPCFWLSGYVHNLQLTVCVFALIRAPSLPHVQAAGAICPPAPGARRAHRSHTAQSHTSSPRAHRSQPDRWTLVAA